MVQDFLEVEIESIAPLSARDATLVDNHSLLNLLNILHGELVILGYVFANQPDLLTESLGLCRKFIRALEAPGEVLRIATETEAYAQRILAEVARHATAQPEVSAESETQSSIENIRSVLGVWAVRAQEILSRARHPMRWEHFETSALAKNFHDVFRAIAANSRGRFGIVYDPLCHTAHDYLVVLSFRTSGTAAIHLPPVLVDVMRDLIANARKYTAPGGEIVAELQENRHTLEFTVQDTGRGIPEKELREVVEFGRRGSNVADVRTMGAGFGLTKAFLVTKRFGGRFWIASKLGQGTRIRLSLPRPLEAGEAGEGASDLPARQVSLDPVPTPWVPGSSRPS